jgi:hypothetical protein
MANFVTLSYFLYFIPLLPLTGFLENAVIRTQLRHSIFPLAIFFSLPTSNFEEKVSNFKGPMLAIGDAAKLFQHERVESDYHPLPYGEMNGFSPKVNYTEFS